MENKEQSVKGGIPMRLFTAIRPSPAAEEALLAAQAELRRLGRGSFPRREMLHLTLARQRRRWRPSGVPGPFR